MINLYYSIKNSYFPINNFSLFEMDTRNGRGNEAKYDIQTERTIANNFVCYHLETFSNDFKQKSNWMVLYN